MNDPMYTDKWQGGISPSELRDIKEGDYDRKTGKKKCAFCRLPLTLRFADCCDEYCYRNEHGGVPVGRPYPHDNERGRGWLSI